MTKKKRKRKANHLPTYAEQVAKSAPVPHNPTKTNDSNKRDKIDKAIQKAEKEDG